MKPDSSDILKDPTIPVEVRQAFAQGLQNVSLAEAQNDLELKKLEAQASLEDKKLAAQKEIELSKSDIERRKNFWGAPFIAAIAGLVTLAGTSVFNAITARFNTENTITIEQVKSELAASETRLKQEFDARSATTAAQQQALAKEREFQYEIVKAQLTNSGMTNDQRAKVLLFLARAGVLNSLNVEELKSMAAEQIADPKADIVPKLASRSSTIFDWMWKVNKVPVCWENPEPKWQNLRIIAQTAVADTWSKYGNIDFVGWQSCSQTNSGIRIKVADESPHSMAIGRNLDGIPSGVVINFEFSNWAPSCKNNVDVCVRAQIVHEFGHVLGFTHEQNRPDAPESCRGMAQGEPDSVMLTPYDPDSVMNYCNPRFSNDGVLSSFDVQKVQMVYGPRTP